MIVTDTSPLRLEGNLWRSPKGLKDVTFKGIAFDKPVRLDGAENVTFDGCTFKGIRGKDPGLTIHGGANIKVTGGEFADWQTGIKAFDVKGLTVSYVSFHHICFDGLILGQVVGFLIEGNTFNDWVPFGTKHPDAIQAVRPDLRTGVTRDGVIRGNLVNVRASQGIFVPQVENVVIEGNTVTTDLATAYGLGKSVNVTLRDNVAITSAPSATIARFDAREAVGLKLEAGNSIRPYGKRTAALAIGDDDDGLQHHDRRRAGRCRRRVLHGVVCGG